MVDIPFCLINTAAVCGIATDGAAEDVQRAISLEPAAAVGRRAAADNAVCKRGRTAGDVDATALAVAVGDGVAGDGATVEACSAGIDVNATALRLGLATVDSAVFERHSLGRRIDRAAIVTRRGAVFKATVLEGKGRACSASIMIQATTVGLRGAVFEDTLLFLVGIIFYPYKLLSYYSNYPNM